MSDSFTGKFLVQEDGIVLQIVGENETYVFAKEHDVKDAPQAMLAISDLEAPHAYFFDSAFTAQKYVEENFEDGEDEVNG